MNIFKTGFSNLMDKKTCDGFQEILVDECRVTQLNLIRISLDVAFQKLIKFVRRKASEQPSFVLSSSFIPNYFKKIMIQLSVKAEYNLYVVLIFQSIIKYILKLKKVCELWNVVISPNLQNLVFTGILDSLNNEHFLRVYEYCNATIQNSKKVQDQLASYNFIQLYLMLKNVCQIEIEMQHLTDQTLLLTQNLCNDMMYCKPNTDFILSVINKRNLYTVSNLVYLKVI